MNGGDGNAEAILTRYRQKLERPIAPGSFPAGSLAADDDNAPGSVDAVLLAVLDGAVQGPVRDVLAEGMRHSGEGEDSERAACAKRVWVTRRDAPH